MIAANAPRLGHVERAAATNAREAAIADLEGAMADILRTAKTWNGRLAAGFDPPLPVLAFGVLRHIRMHGPLRAGEIAEAFDVDKAVVSRQLAVLRDAGLVETTEDPTDRRAVLVGLTPRAVRQLDAARAEVRATYASVLDDWAVDDIGTFAGALRRLRESLSRAAQLG